MKDTATAIRSAYYTALNNVVMLNSAPVAFYDQVPSDSAYPYIYVSDFTCTEETTKDAFGWNATITLVATMKYPANYGGQTDIDNIASQIENIVRGSTTTTQPLSFAPNFQNVITQLDQSNFFKVQVADGVVFYRTMKFRHRVQEIN